MSNIIKEIDKMSGAEVPSHTITDALKKLGAGPSKNITDALSRVEVGGDYDVIISGVEAQSSVNLGALNSAVKNPTLLVIGENVSEIQPSLPSSVKILKILGQTTVGNGVGMSAPNLEELIAPEVTELNAAFSNTPHLSKVYMPSLVEVGSGVFCGESIVNVDFPNLKKIGPASFTETSTSRGCRIKTINLPNLEEIGGPDDGGPGAFQMGSTVMSADEQDTFVFPKLKTIGGRAFYRWLNAKAIILPAVETIGSQVLTQFGYSRLDDAPVIYVGPNCISINSDAFSGFQGTLNCGFSEGSVEGAPWGAQGTATINYDVPVPTK